MADWRTSTELPGRLSPDSTEVATGRIGAGAVVTELDRLGVWVRVRAADGDVWWVDGRRLEPVDRFAAEADPQGALSLPPQDAALFSGQVPHRRGPPLVLVATALVGVGLLFAGLASLAMNRPSGDTRTAVEGTTTSTEDVSPVPSPTSAPLAMTSTTTPAPTTTEVHVTRTDIRLGEGVDPELEFLRPRVTALAVSPRAVWAVRSDTGVLYRVDPTVNDVSLSVALSDRGTSGTSYALDVGFGSVWVTRNDRIEVFRVDEQSGEVMARIEAGFYDTMVRGDHGGTDIAVTPEGVWVLLEGFLGVELVRIDEATDEVVARYRVNDGASSGGGVVAAHGALWVWNSWSSDGWVARLEPTTGEVTAVAEVSCLAGLAAYRSGILAVDSCPGDGGLHLVEIDSVTGQIIEQHDVALAGRIASAEDRLAMATTIQGTPAVVWWPGRIGDTPVYRALADLGRIADLVVADETVWLGTFESPLLVRLDGMWGGA